MASWIDKIMGLLGARSGEAPAPSIAPVAGTVPAHETAVVFVHGFTGSGAGTWAHLAPKIAQEAGLSGWDFWTVTYASNAWQLDIKGLWSANADLTTIAKQLATDINVGALAQYRRIVLVAHSMGGLIVQKALVDDPQLASKTHAVILYGTPSNGLLKALPGQSINHQAADMVKGGAFITELRADWTARFGQNAPFSFLAVAGANDQFVPPASSLEPFPEYQRAVVAGNHVTMLSPSSNDESAVKLAMRRIVEPRGSDVGDSALRAIELGEFNRIIDERYDKANEIDRRALRELAIALDAVGRRADAYNVLAARHDLDTDALGVMAGRLKRKWLLSGRLQADANAAIAHYQKAYGIAVAENDMRQAYYHGVNLAFFALVYEDNIPVARNLAKKVLEHCDQCEQAGEGDEWLSAARGEAELICGRKDAAFAAYRDFVARLNDPWKLSSTYLNARHIAGALGDSALARELGEIFGDPKP